MNPRTKVLEIPVQKTSPIRVIKGPRSHPVDNPVQQPQERYRGPKTAKTGFRLKSCTKNPDFEKGLRILDPIPFDACLRDDKATRIYQVKTAPKWITKLQYDEWQIEGGELVEVGEYETNELKSSNNRKIKSLDAFCKTYETPYRQRGISILFVTLTRANAARVPLKVMMHLIKKRLKSIGFNITGFIWTAEVSEKLHWHYHLALALDKRMNIRGGKLPKQLRFEAIWGQRTETEFVKNNVRHYMAKYFAKHQARVIGQRSYGKSRTFKTN